MPRPSPVPRFHAVRQRRAYRLLVPILLSTVLVLACSHGAVRTFELGDPLDAHGRVLYVLRPHLGPASSSWTRSLRFDVPDRFPVPAFVGGRLGVGTPSVWTLDTIEPAIHEWPDEIVVRTATWSITARASDRTAEHVEEIEVNQVLTRTSTCSSDTCQYEFVEEAAHRTLFAFDVAADVVDDPSAWVDAVRESDVLHLRSVLHVELDLGANASGIYASIPLASTGSQIHFR